MPQYLSPGVYVEEVPSAVQAIVGVSTSTGGFIGKAPNKKAVIPPGPVFRIEDETVDKSTRKSDGQKVMFDLKNFPVVTQKETFKVAVKSTPEDAATLRNDFEKQVSNVVFTKEPDTTAEITVSYDVYAKAVRNEAVGMLLVTENGKLIDKDPVGSGDGKNKVFRLINSPVVTRQGEFQVFVDEKEEKAATLQNSFVKENSAFKAVSNVTFTEAPSKDTKITVTYKTGVWGVQPDEEKEVGTGDGVKPEFALTKFPVITRRGTFQVFVTPTGGTETEDKSATLQNDFKSDPPKSKVVFPTPPATGAKIRVKYLAGKELRLASYPVQVKEDTFSIHGGTTNPPINDFRERASFLQITALTGDSEAITADYLAMPPSLVVHKEKIGLGNASTKKFKLANYPVDTTSGMFAVRVGDYQSTEPAEITIENKDETKSAWVNFTDPPPLNAEIWADYIVQPIFSPLMNEVKLCTSFSEYRKNFGDFSSDPDLSKLAHAVYGFFHNGGSRCYVAVVETDTDISKILEKFEAIDEIAIVAAPGITDDAIRDKIVTHCKIATQDRFAIFDSPEKLAEDDLTLLSPSNPSRVLPGNSDYAAFYFPWIQVFDPAEKTMRPSGDGRIYVPPDGHLAGIYARVDNTRGVHKAPANEVVLGALGLKYKISKAQQDGLNPQGVNCIREMNGNIKVWGARTIGGDANGEWRYINVRRTMLYLRESIDEGTQWAVFEPNDQNLWAKITRNITAFLTTQWRLGMLFGSTAAEAFYVKCDAETNPAALREIGQVVTEIGVSIVRPAEFVIFRISQWQPQTAG